MPRGGCSNLERKNPCKIPDIFVLVTQGEAKSLETLAFCSQPDESLLISACEEKFQESGHSSPIC
jgi:hypothetical protein